MIEIVRPQFRVSVGGEPLTITVESAGLRQVLIPVVGVDTADGIDRETRTGAPSSSTADDCEVVTWRAESTNWDKHYELAVHRDHMTFRVRLEGSGAVDSIRYFAAIDEATYRPDHVLTKHFNDGGFTPPREYARRSPAGFDLVMTPEPTSHARQHLRAHEYAQVSVNADLDYGGGNFVANPGMLAVAVATVSAHEWWSLGLLTQPGAHLFSELEYHGDDGFCLEVNAWGALKAQGHLEPPAVMLAPAASALEAFSTYVAELRRTGCAPSRGSTGEPSWWTRPIVCGWGHQSHQGDLFRIRSPKERAKDNAVYTLCTQTNYDDIVGRLAAEDVPFGTVVIDARWFLAGGLKDVDTGRWPDMAGFIAEQHREGRRVLLWWSPWDPEGVAPEECITWSPEAALRPNRPGRQEKFGTPTPGKKLGVDITLQAVRARIRAQVRHCLSPEGLDADGFKIDHLSATPGLHGMVFPQGSAGTFGIEAAHAILSIIYQTAKETKPDALVIGQSPNPYFIDVQDMVRLGDIYSRHHHSVVPEMTFRAQMAGIATPELLIDTDGWPMPSLAAWREYVEAQPQIGVPSLYYATHLDTSGEALGPADYALLRRAWRSL